MNASLKFIIVISFCLISGTPIQALIWNVFGPDERVPVTSYDYPYRTIGYIDGSHCTGVLVGKQLVLTAAHCVLTPKTQEIRTDLTYFYPNRIHGKSYQKSWITHIWVGTRDLDNHQEDDWALLQLADKLGEGFGWMEIEEETDSIVQCAGYSADYKGGRTMTLHDKCKIVSESHDILLHNCHATRGSSGAPIFIMKNGKAYLVALNVGEFRGESERSLFLPQYDEKYANTAIKTSRFESKLKELREKE